ncbi:SH3 domain-containing protein [Streptomyces sp. WAC07061]|uniref:SH3 domain-containing protein n=1 Tax=Streptomyces sp. WAC07061 TaxID=2487410 RepID=UPI000F776E7D|nr:SH3 domain-containing protein [Streptomyces sp. WAC07061]RSS48315.1 SH3 domain-containing protein [Streptomyces sp. WAC07061]
MSLLRLPLIAATAATAGVLSVGVLSAVPASAAPMSVPASARALSPASATGNCAYQVSPDIDALNVRSGPGVNYAALGTLAPGTYVSAVGCGDWVPGPGGNGWWVRIEYGRGSAYVSTQYLNGLP